MKGDAFREMAAQCGELPDSVMAVPGLEYVGEKSAEWEALCARTARWLRLGPLRSEPLPAAEFAGLLRLYESVGLASVTVASIAGLARFARLMAIVTREE